MVHRPLSENWKGGCDYWKEHCPYSKESGVHCVCANDSADGDHPAPKVGPGFYVALGGMLTAMLGSVFKCWLFFRKKKAKDPSLIVNGEPNATSDADDDDDVEMLV